MLIGLGRHKENALQIIGIDSSVFDVPVAEDDVHPALMAFGVEAARAATNNNTAVGLA